MTEVGEESPTGFEASRYFSNQRGCTGASSLNSICCRGGLLLPRVPMEGSSVGADPIALRHSVWLVLWGQSPALLSAPGAEVSASRSWTTSKALRTPCSCLLRAGWLQSPSSQAPSRSSLDSCCQLAPKNFYAREGWVFPVSLMEGHVRSPQASHHPSSPTTVGGSDEKRDFFRVPSHFKDWFSNYLKFLNGAHVSLFHKRGHSAVPLGLYYFAKMLWLVYFALASGKQRRGGFGYR